MTTKQNESLSRELSRFGFIAQIRERGAYIRDARQHGARWVRVGKDARALRSFLKVFGAGYYMGYCEGSERVPFRS